MGSTLINLRRQKGMMIDNNKGIRRTPNQTKSIKVCSWNVQGVRDPVKRQAIFSMAEMGNIKMLCL